MAGGPAAAGVRARTGHRRAGDDRSARRAARAAGQGAARVRTSPARLPGADAPLRDRSADRGHDPRRARRRTAVFLLARGRPLRRDRHSPSKSQTGGARPASLSRQGPPALRWALEAAQCARRRSSPDHAYYLEAAARLRRQPRLPVRGPRTAQAQLPHAARTRRGGAPARITTGLRALPQLTPMHRGRLPARSCRHERVDGLHRQSGRNAFRSGITPSTIMSPARRHVGSRTEIRLGARAHTDHTLERAHAPPETRVLRPRPRLTPSTRTDKEQPIRRERERRESRSRARRRPLIVPSERLAGPAVAPVSVGAKSKPARDRPARRAPGLLVLFRGGLWAAGEECFGIAVLARVARGLSMAGREQHQQTHCGERRQPVDVSRRQQFDHIATDDAARTRELGDNRRDVPEAQPARLRPPGSWGDAGIQPSQSIVTNTSPPEGSWSRSHRYPRSWTSAAVISR